MRKVRIENFGEISTNNNTYVYKITTDAGYA